MTNKFVQYLIKLSALSYPQPEYETEVCNACGGEGFIMENQVQDTYICSKCPNGCKGDAYLFVQNNSNIIIDENRCPECGSFNFRVEDLPEDYCVNSECFDCGYENSDGYEDMQPCMSVPWGFLL